MVAAIAAGSIQAKEIAGTLQTQNQSTLGAAYADWHPWRSKLNAAVAELVKAKKFDMAATADFSALYTELAAGLEAIR
jgi:fibrillarin-like rRNA methylase